MISSIDDGTTLHAQLLSTGALTQAWANGAATPNWGGVDGGPTIYVDLLNGLEKVAANDGNWYYNGELLTFAAGTGKNTAGSHVRANLFQKVTYTPTGYSNPVPALKVIGNIAASDNYDNDTLMYSGSYTIGQNQTVSIAVQTTIRITSITTNGIWGLIETAGNGFSFDTDGETKVLYGRLYNADGTELTNFTTTWKLSGVSIGSGTTIGGHANAVQITESQVTDNAILECTFSYTPSGGSQQEYTAFEELADNTDDEQIMTQIIVNNDNAGGTTGGNTSLRKGQTAQVRVWVAPANALEGRKTTWQHFYVKLYPGTSDSPVTASNIEGLTTIDANGDSVALNPVSTTQSDNLYAYRKMGYDNYENGAEVHKWGEFSVTYNAVVNTFAKNLSGLILASETDLANQ